jgi:hypothetical protein
MLDLADNQSRGDGGLLEALDTTIPDEADVEGFVLCQATLRRGGGSLGV